MAKNDKIKLANNNSVRFPSQKEMGNILIIGNFDGVCGTLNKLDDGKFGFGIFSEALRHNGGFIAKTLKAGKHIYLISTEETKRYFQRLLTIFRDKGWLDCVGRDKAIKRQLHWCELDCTKEDNEIIDCINNKLYNGLNEMKFDTIIQNPPYNKSLHLDFFEKGLDLLSENGKMVIIEPATWLINVRKNGKAKKYDEIKKRIEGHVESVIIENLNKDFNTNLYMPFATTTIDMSKTFDTIKFVCCGEEKEVKSIYDCNLIGDYATICGILDKCQKFGDMMENHITKEAKGEGVWYAKYPEILSMNLCGGGEGRFSSNEMYRKHNGNDYYLGYTAPGFHSDRTSDIQSTPNERRDKGGKKIEGSIADCLFGTREELENWKHFIFNNKLPLFLNIVLTIDQHNNSKPFLPWFVDRQYTDDEINQILGFTDDEIAMINSTIKKYERNSPWFKRYMCGPDSVSDEEVNNFIKSIN